MELTLDNIRNLILEKLDALSALVESMPPLYLWCGIGAFIAVLLILLVALVIGKGKKKRDALSEKEEHILEDIDVEAEVDTKVAAPAPISEEEITPSPEPEVVTPVSFFARLKQGLTKTRSTFSGGLDRIFSGNRVIDDDLLEEIEELLITSDMGVQTTLKIVQNISKKSSDISDAVGLRSALKKEILSLMSTAQESLKKKEPTKPNVIMVVGVNGVGKTTTIGKLAARFASEGKKVLVVAGDTFRAAAIEQLTIWAEKSGSDIVKHRDGADPAAVAYDGVEAAIAREVDVVLIDTAGRLHTKVNLMEQLKKITRAISKSLPDAPHEILVVLDATTGQNALSQVKLFHEVLGITGIALTKLDGTAKGGIVIGICSTLNIPLEYIGVGEKTDDLQDFDPEQFVDALF